MPQPKPENGGVSGSNSGGQHLLNNPQQQRHQILQFGKNNHPISKSHLTIQNTALQILLGASETPTMNPGSHVEVVVQVQEEAVAPPQDQEQLLVMMVEEMVVVVVEEEEEEEEECCFDDDDDDLIGLFPSELTWPSSNGD
ncbi:hypothetical protein Cni_G24731 [Canna indica]|uniref:Uncharacterized protein n=1 Tax=Canna indica TaxID=4628 RepID=A0AAQ3KWE9_9LILI|nr:hypothetical protein Cni_G24731 [Canna indica]